MVREFKISKYRPKYLTPKSALTIEGNSGEFRLALTVAVLSLFLGAAANSTTTFFANRP